MLLPTKPTLVSHLQLEVHWGMSLLKAGDVLVVKKKGVLDLLGSMDELLQGGTKGAHVCLVLPNSNIATTGAKFGCVYGEVAAGKYMRGKEFYLLRTVDPLTEAQLGLIQEAHRNVMRSGIKRLYGLQWYPILGLLAFLHGNPTRVGTKDDTKPPAFPICSVVTGYLLWHAGVTVGKMFGQEDYTALRPGQFLAEAQATEMEGPGKHPCMFLSLKGEYRVI